MRQKKLKLRPWVKATLIFVFGVFAVSQIFSIVGTEASEEEPETKVIHGVVKLQLNGKAELSILESEYIGKDISVDLKKGYDYFEVVTVVIKGSEVVKDYLTTDNELKSIEKKYVGSLQEIRRNIYDALYGEL